MTDVTGFALLGHLLEVCRGSKAACRIDLRACHFGASRVHWQQQGYVTGAAARNWQSYGHDVQLEATLPEWQNNLLSDPQTSGGLLVACAPEAAAGCWRYSGARF